MSVVAIDGPAGAGKTTIARAVAEALGWDYVDTGAMYRAIALRALQAGVNPHDGDAVARVAAEADIVSSGRSITLDGMDVSSRIRETDVTRAVPAVAAHADVRATLVELQREAARTRDIVMEGRDIGSVVVPDALVKVFLTASLEERARRRAEELGSDARRNQVRPRIDVAAIKEMLAERDEVDSSRAASPLLKADGAVEIDTTNKTIDEIRDEITTLVQERLDGS